MVRLAKTAGRFRAVGALFALALLGSAPAWGATTLFVRGDGGGSDSDSNDGSTWTLAFATIQKALNTLDSSDTFTVNVQAGTYDVATRNADTGDVTAAFEGGWTDVDGTPVQTGRTLVTDGDGTVDEPGFFFRCTGSSHDHAKTVSFHLFDFAGVVNGIHLFNPSNVGSAEIALTLDDCTISANGTAVTLDYARIDDCTINATNCTILGGQNSGTGDAIFMAGDPATSSITSCTISSAGGKGLNVLAECGGGSFGPGFTFNITDSSISDCTDDGVNITDVIVCHYNTNSTVNLTRVKLANNGGDGFFRQQDDGNSTARFFILNATNVLFANNTDDGIRLIGNIDLGGGNKGAPFQATLVNCTVADNGGDGLFLISDIVGSTSTVTAQNSIFAGNAGNGIDASVDDGVTTGTMTVTDAICDFFGNTSNDILVNGANQALTAGSVAVTADPLFCGLNPDPYQLFDTSTLLDAGSAAFAPADDILGTSRPVGAGDSIGAYEDGVPDFQPIPTANGQNPYAHAAPDSVLFEMNPIGGTLPYTAFEWFDLDTSTVLSTLQNFTLNYTALDVGVHNIRATVTDDAGNSASAVVVVTINPPLSITASGTPSAGSTADGASWDLTSTPANGSPPYVSFLWSLVSPGGATISFGGTETNQNATVSITSPTDTPITVQILVTDNEGDTATATVVIFRATNPVTASADVSHVPTGQLDLASVTVVEGSTVLLDGIPGGGSGVYTHSWTQPALVAFSANTEDASDTPAPTAANPQPLTYTYKVTDSNGLFATATVTVTVVDPIVPVPSSNPTFINLSGGPQTAILSVVTTGGSPQNGGSYVSIVWIDLTNGSAVIGSGTPVSGYAPTVTPGLNTVQVTVTDDLGFTGTATLDIFVIESAMTVTAEGTYVIAGTTITGTTLSIFAGDSISLAGTVTGGSGVFLYDWTGPGGFTSTVEDPGTATPPAVAGPYTYTLTVTDVNTGQIVVATVTVTSSDSINNQGLFVGNGKVKYKATTASTPEKGKDYAKIWLEGVAFSVGDRVAFDFNGRPIGDIAGGSSIVLDSKLKGSGQLGPLFGPNFFPKVTVKYKATKIRLDAKCMKGDFEPFNQGAPLTSAVTGLSPIVNVTVFVDRAPADGVVDDTIVLPLMFKVKAKMNAQGVFTESGKKVAP